MSLRDRIESSPERMRDFQRERLEMEITELICEIMEEDDVSRAELARRLGKSGPYVTKLLRDGTNMTVRTIADIFHALGRSLRVVDRPLSIHSPRLLVMEAPSGRGRVVPSANYRFELPDAQRDDSVAPPNQPHTPSAA